jgi:hypothetical protein
VLEYVRDLIAHGYSKCKKWPFAVGRFRNGVAIPDMGRRLHQEAPELTAKIADPFSDEGFDALVAVWNQPSPHVSRSDARISRLAYRIYRSRPDIQAAMPDIFGRDRNRFLDWLLSSGRSEHRLDDRFLTSAREGPDSAADGPELLPESFLGIAEGTLPAKKRTLRMTHLSTMIWNSRAELQRVFPRSLRPGRGKVSDMDSHVRQERISARRRAPRAASPAMGERARRCWRHRHADVAADISPGCGHIPGVPVVEAPPAFGCRILSPAPGAFRRHP